MRFLIVCYSYKPKVSPRAFRWAAIAEEWAKDGHQVDVVCAWYAGLFREEKIAGVNIYRVGFGRRFGNSISVEYVYSLDDKKRLNFIRLFIKPLISILKVIYNISWKKLYWPDQACLWILPSYRKTNKLLKTYNYDMIITVSHPFSGHLVGLLFKKVVNAVPWLVDIGDPFSFLEKTPVNNDKLYNFINRKAEQRVFNTADIVAVTTESTKQKYAELFPNNMSKVYVIPPLLNVFELQDYVNDFLKCNKNNERIINMVFLGTLYESIRSPEYLLEIFSELLKIVKDVKLQLHFIGSISGCEQFFKRYRELINKFIYLHGRVDRSEALKAMVDADMLVNIGNNTAYQLPSKIVEYIYTGKPILNIVDDAQSDSSALFLKDYPVAFTLEKSHFSMKKEKLEEILDFIKTSKPISRKDVELLVYKYKSSYIAKKYLDLLITLVKY